MFLGGFFIWLNFVMLSRTSLGQEIFRIAVVGGGIGGASTTHFLMKEFPSSKLQIDIFVPSDVQIGGRLKTSQFPSSNVEQKFEVGGSIIHGDNRYMVNFTKLLGLEQLDVFTPKESDPMQLAIWDGRRVKLATSSWSWVETMQFIWRYGLRNMVRLKYMIRDLLKEFENIYKLQDSGLAFTNVEDMLRSMSPGFVNLTRRSLSEELAKRGFNHKFINELAAGAMRNNYGGQNVSDVHAFVGMISLAGASNNLWAVKGGNAQVPQLLLEQYAGTSQVTLKRDRVLAIRRTTSASEAPSFALRLAGHQEESTGYDFVVIAAPQTHRESKNIVLDNVIPGSRSLAPYLNWHYQQVYVTFVKGNLNLTQFRGLSANARYNLLTGTPVRYTSFYSIGAQATVEGAVGENVWKIFGPKSLTKRQVVASGLFKNVELVETLANWRGYPRYQSSVSDLPKFLVAPNLVYLNAIEQAASAMEMSALAGRNAALLARNTLLPNYKHLIDVSAPEIDEIKAKEEL